jgi:hypothetical protein
MSQPFLLEELWQHLGIARSGTIVATPWVRSTMTKVSMCNLARWLALSDAFRQAVATGRASVRIHTCLELPLPRQSRAFKELALLLVCAASMFDNRPRLTHFQVRSISLATSKSTSASRLKPWAMASTSPSQLAPTLTMLLSTNYIYGHLPMLFVPEPALSCAPTTKSTTATPARIP